MTSPAIIEAAARAMAEWYAEPEDYDGWSYLGLAGAAVAAVTPLIEAAALEKAAKEAEVFSRHENWEVMSVVRRIAAAIRALNKPMEKT